jgi:acetylglutamate kinase
MTHDDSISIKAGILSEALPFMRRHSDKTIVIKYGGHAMGNAELGAEFARDIVLLKQIGVHPIVVHGGGPQIGQMLERLNIKSNFVNGLRVTDAATMEIAEMVLSGSINKEIVALINGAGGLAIGLSGKDGNLIQARKIGAINPNSDSNIEKATDLGFVGEPVAINTKMLEVFDSSDIIPVIAPIGVGANGETYNINADTAAGAIAGALGASRLLMLTDTAGVLDANKAVMPEITTAQARDMIAAGTIYGGMIPKVETCLEAVEKGVEAAVILDGRRPHAILVELLSEAGAGTMIRKKS